MLNAEITAEVAPHRAPEAETPEAQIPEIDSPQAEAAEPNFPEVQAPLVDSPGVETLEAGTPEASAPALMQPMPPRVKTSARLREPVNPTAVDPVVKDAGPTSQEHTDLLSAESPTGLTPWQSGARHRRGAGTLVCVSDLLPASMLSAGRSGRRRAEEPVEERPDGAPVAEIRRLGDGVPEEDNVGGQQAREFAGSGPPPAPTLRTMEWEAGSASEGESPQTGLGDLLAEALAASQESRDVRADNAGPTGLRSDDGGTAVDIRKSRSAPPYGRPGTRGTFGLQLASPIDRREDDPSEALTNPLLRLPDLTTEPLWIFPETSRRSAAGD